MKKTSLNKKILILGATGLIGKFLLTRLQDKGCKVFGTTRSKKKLGLKMLKLDITKTKSVEKFPWAKFDIIINCTGQINYHNNLSTAQTNILINTLLPLHIIQNLNSKQVYYHCSTHIIALPPHQHNTYSLSKLFFEQINMTASPILPRVVILRIPGIFYEKRRDGLLYAIGQHFSQKKSLEIDFEAYHWHIMYLPRLADIIVSLLHHNCQNKTVNIGYPVETSLEQIIHVANKAFGHSIPISFKQQDSDHYVPDLKIQNQYIKIKPRHFAEDLMVFFKTYDLSYQRHSRQY